MTTTTATTMGAGFPNKHPSACAFCTLRVKRGEGTVWRRDGIGEWLCAHVACLAKACAGGQALRMDMPTSAKRLRDIREIMRAVRLDAPETELDAALEAIKAIAWDRLEDSPF